MILLASSAFVNSTITDDADLVEDDLVNQLRYLISALGINGLLSCRRPFLNSSKLSIADSVFPVLRELSQSLHVCACGCFDTGVTTLELIG